MNELDRGPRRPSRGLRAIARQRRFLDTPWAALAAGALIMLVIALAALAGSTATI